MWQRDLQPTQSPTYTRLTSTPRSVAEHDTSTPRRRRALALAARTREMMDIHARVMCPAMPAFCPPRSLPRQRQQSISKNSVMKPGHGPLPTPDEGLTNAPTRTCGERDAFSTRTRRTKRDKEISLCMKTSRPVQGDLCVQESQAMLGQVLFLEKKC